MDAGLSNVEVHVDVLYAVVKLPGFSGLVTLALHGGHDVDARVIAARRPVSGDRQHHDPPVYVVLRYHLEARYVEFQSNAILVHVDSERASFRQILRRTTDL